MEGFRRNKIGGCRVERVNYSRLGVFSGRCEFSVLLHAIEMIICKVLAWVATEGREEYLLRAFAWSQIWFGGAC